MMRTACHAAKIIERISAFRL